MERAIDFVPVAFLVVGAGIYQTELCHSWQAVLATGGQPVLVAPSGGQIELVRGQDLDGSMPVDVEVPDASATDFAGLVLPDGDYAGDGLRGQPGALAFVHAFFAAGLPVAAIGGAARVLVAANALRGRRLTAAPGLRTELTRAGANWADERVVVCELGRSVLVTARERADLPVFCRAFTRRFFCRA